MSRDFVYVWGDCPECDCLVTCEDSSSLEGWLCAPAGARASGRRLSDLGDVTVMEFKGVRVPGSAQ
jgi:hypothetical protein